ncbi:CoA transferase subunit A [Metabacillus fastidiosus]|uniref:CoA transferase subunit A n=1 Tax=Metabacillus fastidiosus TaxID=1458 RepID=A0ABU6P7C4_9BACI|nr:CoA transferase subunit A [Metabacillus fastidiosus]MED4404066.1 CoA transferase subunit A [Metabacillus fastidiosus]MED4455184.1 CoA transferase subunit A [Metabacillus fastidiosus]MED4462770.1 CoA transferase subunit A [Metabacillus fastidiosus]
MGQKVKKIEEVLDVIKSGSTIMIGGFGGIGNPPTLIQAILERGIRDLTIICNDTGFPAIGVGKLITNGRVKKVIVSHIGSNPIAGRLMEEGKLEVEFSPQGTLAERIRAGGVGLGGVLTDVGIDNEIVQKGKKIVEADGRKYLLETALTADTAIIFGKESDHFGNLIYDKSARNMNPLMAMAADYTIAEVESIVPDGSLDAESIITPGVFVQAVIKTDGVNWKWVWE